MKNPLKNKTFVLFSLGLVLTLLLSLGFVLGGWYSCSTGGGTLTGLKCQDVEVIKACEDLQGNKFKVDPNTPNLYLNLSAAMEAIE